MSTTANTICIGALTLLGIIDPEDAPSNPMLADAFRRLNMMMGQWSLQNLTIPVEEREVFPIVAGKGSPTTPYTYGPNGDFNSSRPLNLNACGLLLNTNPSIPVEIPRAVLTDQDYQNIQIKTLTNALFTNVYYNATFAAGLGTVYLWPVPDGSQSTSIALYRNAQLGLFTSPTASYDLPEGADEAVEYNLAKRLLDVYSVDATKKLNIIDVAKTSLAIYKRSNMQMFDLPTDQMFLIGSRRSGGYNINTGDES